MTKLRGFEVVKRLADIADSIKLPERSTKNSAGYDFFLYEDVTIPSSIFDTTIIKDGVEEAITPYFVKTGIKAYMQPNEVLKLYNRSSNPKKLGLVLANSVGIVDSDYYENPDNDGEIAFAFYNLSPNDVTLAKGTKIGQGIFQEFLKSDDDDVDAERLGGFGSTGN